MLALVWAVTVLSVTFATRGTMATNRPIVEVLHYVGATDSFISSQFQRHFLILGFKGGAIGGGVAILLFAVAEAANAWLAGTPGGDEIAGLFGNLSIGDRRLSGDLAANRLYGPGDGVRLAPNGQSHARSHRLKGVNCDRLPPSAAGVK